MSDLYQHLGVGRDADPEQIDKAYRALARVNHPDRGGDPEKFHPVQTAYDVLRDPERRRRYDETGEFDTQDKSQLAMAHILSQAFYEALKKLTESGRDVKMHNVVGLMRTEAGNLKQKFADDLKKVIKTIKRFEDAAARFRGNGAVTMRTIAGEHIKSASVDKNRLELSHRGAELALDFLKECEYEVEPEPGTTFTAGGVATFDYSGFLERMLGKASSGKTK